MIEIIGYIAGTLTTISFLPQAVKSIKTKNTEGISLLMYLIFASGVSCWLIYGIFIANFAIIMTNIITLPLSLIIIYIKIKNIMTSKAQDLQS